VSEAWQKRLLFVAAAWNVLGGASAVFDPAQHFAQMYTASLATPAPLHEITRSRLDCANAA